MQITFNNGTTARSDMCVEAAGRLTFTAYGLTIAEAVEIADKPENVRVVEDKTGTHEGYTELLCIAKEGDHLRITLGKAQG